MGRSLKCGRSVFSGKCSTVYCPVYGGSFFQPVHQLVLWSQLAKTIFRTLTFLLLRLEQLHEYDGLLTITYQQLVYTTQVNSAFGARWLASPEVITQVLYYSPPRSRRETKWLPVSLRFPKREIHSMNDKAVPKNTKMATKFGVAVFNGNLLNLFSLIF